MRFNVLTFCAALAISFPLICAFPALADKDDTSIATTEKNALEAAEQARKSAGEAEKRAREAGEQARKAMKRTQEMRETANKRSQHAAGQDE